MKYFFLHIPKTAGTSFRGFLRSNVDPQLLLFVYPDKDHDHQDLPGNWVSFNSLCKNSERYQHKQYVLGHYHYGIHKYFSDIDNDFRYITFVRHPIDRAVSLYKHFLAYPGHEHDVIVQGNLSFSQFLQHPELSQQVNDYMTYVMTGADKNAQQAIQND
jgi:hypothetical protein